MAKPKFKPYPEQDFLTVIKKRVEAEFAAQQISYQANGEMFFKSFLLLTAYCLCYFALISVPFN